MLGVLQFAWGFKIAIPNFTHHLLFGLNGLSMFFLILTVFLSCICLFLNFEKPYKYNDFNFLLWILQIILVLFFTTTDLVIFFTCFELSLIPIFLIILIWGSSVRRVLASYYFYVYTGLGAVLMIIGICLIVFECGTTNMLILQLHKFNGHKQIMLFFFFFWGFAIKIPMFPFHLWLPEAHVEAPTEGSILLAGLLLKLGGYGFIKILISYFPVACIYYSPLVYGMCIASIILTSFEALVQNDFKRLIAYTSVSHMNFAVLGIFSQTIQGLVCAVILMLAHGLVSSGLFAVVGMIYERYSSRQIEYYGGLIIGMPLLGTFFFIMTLGNFGFPLTLNFVGELLILASLAHTNLFVLFASAIGLFLSVAYSIILYNKLMFGNVKPFIRKIKDVTLFEFNSLLSLTLGCLFFGIWPMSVIEPLYMTLSLVLLRF